jgi:hypothetical protein
VEFYFWGLFRPFERETRVVKFQPAIAAAEPGRPLGPEGQRLWNSVAADYRVSNPAAAEILLLACEATDRLVQLRAERKAEQRDGKASGRLERDITQVCALIASLLVKLDRYVARRKPRRGPGRPVTNIFWTPDHALE